jgi:hypothetical protein
VRYLVEYQRYFGIDARTFHDGVQRLRARMSMEGWQHVRIDAALLAAEFALEPVAGEVLLRTLVASGLLNPDGDGGHRPTARFREYALAPLVSPLSREGARATITRANVLAAQINATWAANPHRIDTIAVSGSFMSRSDPLPDLSFWLVLRDRPRSADRRSMPVPSEAGGLRQIAAALKALNPFVTVHVAAERNDVTRPFIVVYEWLEDAIPPPPSPLERLRRWGATLNTRFALR